MLMDNLDSEKRYNEFEEYHLSECSTLVNDIRNQAKKIDKEKEYETYSWVKVKAFKFNESKGFEYNLDMLKIHHYDEINFLCHRLNDLIEENKC